MGTLMLVGELSKIYPELWKIYPEGKGNTQMTCNNIL